MRKSNRFFMIIVIFVIIFIMIFCINGYFNHEKKYRDIVNNVYIGEVGVDYNYTNITFPHIVYSASDFNVTILFNSNISIKFIYTQTTGFRVMHWTFSYNTYIMRGGGQGDFTGTIAENIGVLNITISTPDISYNGNIALHLVGNVPVTVTY